MVVTPGSNKKSKKKGGTPQGKGDLTPQGAAIINKTPQSEKGQHVTPKFQKSHTQTPGSHKSGGATPQAGESGNKTPQFQKGQSITPKSQKEKLQTPGSHKSSGVSPKFSNGKRRTPQSAKFVTPKSEKGQATTPKMPKRQSMTPQSHSGQKQKIDKSQHEQKLKATLMTSPSQKSPKNVQQLQTTAGSPQKTTPLLQSKAGTPPAKLQSSNKKRKLEEDESSSYDSGEEDFEALIGHSKKMKSEEMSPSPNKSAAVLSSSGKLTMALKQSQEKLVAGMKRSYDSDSDDIDDDDESDGDESDEDESDEDDIDDESDDDDEADESDADVLPVKKKQLVPEVAKKKMKTEDDRKIVAVAAARQTSPVKDTAYTLTEEDLARDMKRQDALDRRLLFLKNIPKSANEAQIKALHSGIVNVQLRSMKWNHKSNQQTQLAHVEFKDEKSADDAYKVLSGKTIGDRALTVDYFGAKSSHPGTRKPFAADQLDPCTLFVSRYPLDLTSEELQVLFPTASSVEVLRNREGQPLGFSFVHFKNADACRKAHDKADSLKVRGRTIMVVYARKKSDQPPSRKQAQQAKEKPLPVAKPTTLSPSKPSVGKVAQQMNVAVMKSQQQKAASAKTSQPGVTKPTISGAQFSAGKKPVAAEELDEDSEEDFDDESEDSEDTEDEDDSLDDDDDDDD